MYHIIQVSINEFMQKQSLTLVAGQGEASSKLLYIEFGNSVQWSNLNFNKNSEKDNGYNKKMFKAV